MGTVYAGGWFETAGDNPASRIAAWRQPAWTNMGSGVDYHVSALAQDAKVEVVSGDAARTLEESGGAGVLLRFSPFKSEPAPEGELAVV